MQLLSTDEVLCTHMLFCNAGDDLMDAKPSLLALTPVVHCVPVPMQVVTW